ncbi:hypothetical protein [Rubritalea tangerina]|uniref:hypothetical protein n=1 Tax=Rubritalea tangerina TaxID=430798 RepID=UPI003613E859
MRVRSNDHEVHDDEPPESRIHSLCVTMATSRPQKLPKATRCCLVYIGIVVEHSAMGLSSRT